MMSADIDILLDNLEEAMAAQTDVIRGRQNIIRNLKELEEIEAPKALFEAGPSPLDSGKWMVRVPADRKAIMYNKNEVHLTGSYTDEEENTYEYAHITPAEGVWYLWYNTVGEDAFKAYITNESLLPKIRNRQREEERCRRPEVVIFPIFVCEMKEGKLEPTYIHKDTIFVTTDNRPVDFKVYAYFKPTVQDEEVVAPSPALCYTVYNPTVKIKTQSKEIDVDFLGKDGLWYDLGEYPSEEDDSPLICVKCDVRVKEEQGEILESGDIANHYAVNWLAEGALRYSNYAPLPGVGHYANMFSFPVAGYNAMATALFQFGYNNEALLVGTERDQEFYKENFAPYVDKHEELYNEDCTPQNVLAKIEETVSSAELAILIYSGHGGPLPHCYQLPLKSQLTLAASDVARVISTKAAGRVWLINDCCFGGGHFDDEYDPNASRKLIDEIVEQVRASGSGVQLLGWAGAPPDLVGWTDNDGGIFMQALKATFNPGYSYAEQWAAMEPLHQMSTFYKKACNGFNEDAKLFN